MKKQTIGKYTQAVFRRSKIVKRKHSKLNRIKESHKINLNYNIDLFLKNDKCLNEPKYSTNFCSSEFSFSSKIRDITLERDDKLGFGFIAGSEKPLVIRFVSPSK